MRDILQADKQLSTQESTDIHISVLELQTASNSS
jgi:hypothetical protein